MMTTESLLSKSHADFIYPNPNSHVWVVNDALLKMRVHPGTTALIRKETPSSGFRPEVTQNYSDDSKSLPSIFGVKSSSATSSAFGVTSEGQNGESDSVKSQILFSAGGLATQDEIDIDVKSTSSSLKIRNDTCLHTADESNSALPTNILVPVRMAKSGTLSPKQRKSMSKKKKSSAIVKKSQTTQCLSGDKKSREDAPRIKIHIRATQTLGELNSLKAQCKAVQIHQHVQKVTGAPIHLPIANCQAMKSAYTHKPYTVSKSGHLISGSSPSRGDNSNLTGSSLGCVAQNLHLSRRSLAHAEDVYLKRVTKVFLSEKQSGTINDFGIEMPCAPPATPTPEQLMKYEYVPSLGDVRAQRAVRQRLQVIEKKEQKKLDRQREEQAKEEKLLLKDREMGLKRRQRQEIYALNKIMTDLEHKRFLEFCATKGLNS